MSRMLMSPTLILTFSALDVTSQKQKIYEALKMAKQLVRMELLLIFFF